MSQLSGQDNWTEQVRVEGGQQEAETQTYLGN